ncbi:MAG: TonB-dependent receptor [Pseudomonadales bacterium]
MRCSGILAIFVALQSSFVTADHAENAPFFEEVTIVGNAEQEAKITGSAHFLSDEDLAVFAYTDIQRILREIPGVSIQVEDGYGLRPNIGLRGVPTERSARIVLLEDNVPVAPAPYAASAAYYFPTIGRMYNVEVVKGPASITQGPNTIGGAVNFVSTPVPQLAGGSARIEVGSDSTTRTHLTYGATSDTGFGYMFETHQWKSGGFQHIDRSNADTGLDVEDYTLKLAYEPTDSSHALELKLQYAQQDSNQSYLGLSDADFNNDPYRRYGVTALDNISTEHNQQTVRYEFEIADNATISATAYNNEHKRAWFKTEKLVDGVDEFSWFTVIQNLNNGNGVGSLGSADVQAILDGGDSAADAIEVRDNNRQYYSRGIQAKLDWTFNGVGARHRLETGARLHKDEEDRLQQDFRYTQSNGSLLLTASEALGAAGNQVQRAEAFSIYVLDTISFSRLELTPGLRYENIDLERVRYSDGIARNFRDKRENNIAIFLPGIGARYSLSEGAALIAGVHKGFSAPGNAPDVDEEESTNYEFGLRYLEGDAQFEMIAFYNDYENILGVCTASSGSNCDPGDTSNGGKATVAGVEMSFANRFALGNDLSIPASLVYTFSDSEFDTSFTDTEFFGDVASGDPIPYIPENQATLTLGLAAANWQFETAINYVDAVCVRPSCGLFEQTDASTTVDLVHHVQLGDQLGIYARVENLLEVEDIVGRQPYGARPNKARTATLGFQLSF